jgi:methylthioribose-1-phosphate isomerase
MLCDFTPIYTYGGKKHRKQGDLIKMIDTIWPVRLNDKKDKLLLIDQTLLPNKEKILELSDTQDIWEAIKMLRVRGAPAIGVTAGFAIYLAAKYSDAKNYKQLESDLLKAKSYLATSRPTAVNLFWALDRMYKRMKSESTKPVEEIINCLLEESEAILSEDRAMGKSIGEFGLSLLEPDMGLLTHCNAGALATSGLGTALAPMYLGQDKGYNFKVYADETRPLLQGSRLTAYELQKAGVDVTVICDNMASIVMKQGKIDAVLVGCDRVAANGDAANKIGTSGVAILAKEYGIPFYVLGPTSTIDLDAATGDDIKIEQRASDEVIHGFSVYTAPQNVSVYNPAFDVTDSKYITAIITEKGVLFPPYEEKIKKLFNQ